jgi:NTF2-related export protein 1/2
MPDGKPLPAIVFNGNVIATADAFQKMFVEDMPQTHYDAQSYDCQIINPNYIAAGMAVTDGSKGQNITVLVVISGNVRLGTGKESEVKGSSESVVLVPNPEKALPKAKRKSMKDWLIQSQTFRLVV